MLILQIAFFGVLLLTAPEAMDAIKKAISASAAATVPQPGYSPQPGYPPQPGMPAPGYPPQPGMASPPAAPVGPTVEQRIAELDAAYQRGGMTPEEYHQRRNAIMSGR